MDTLQWWSDLVQGSLVALIPGAVLGLWAKIVTGRRHKEKLDAMYHANEYVVTAINNHATNTAPNQGR
jgi:hypothetical protein